MVYAQINLADPSRNPVAKFSSIGMLINVIVPLIMTVGALSFLVMLLFGAFTYLTSEGSPEKLKKAQSILLFSVVGLLLMVASFIIVRLIGYVLKVEIPV